MEVASHLQVAQPNRGRVSDPAQAALSGSHRKAPGFAGGYLLTQALSQALRRVSSVISGGQLNRNGTPTVPMPRLT